MDESSSQSQCPRPEQNTDRISTLPNSVICHILSFLPTKTSVATSVLFRRWCHLWKNLQVLDLKDNSHEFYDEDGELFKRFAIFVNSILVLRRTRDVQTFRLSCGHSRSNSFHANSVAMWVRTAIGPHLEEMHLTLYSIDGRGFVLPHSLFECTKLKTLSLCGGIHVRKPPTICLLSLKMLHLDIDSVDCIDVLLSGCPTLESLYLSFSPKRMIKVRMPSTLKKLELAIENSVRIELEINSSGLEYLSITQTNGGFQFSIGNLQNMVEAFLDVYAEHVPVNALFMLLKAISSTKILILHRSTTKWLLHAPILEIPKFHNLAHLELILPWFNSSFLMTMLQQCNMLRGLIIQIEKEPTISRSWSQPTNVPECLVSNLSFFQFKGYQGFSDELEFVGYILRNGLVLETVIIHVDVLFDLEKKYHILNLLSIIPRGSNICQLSFH